MDKFTCPICEKELILNKDTGWLTCVGNHKFEIDLEMYKELIKFGEDYHKKLLYGQTDAI